MLSTQPPRWIYGLRRFHTIPRALRATLIEELPVGPRLAAQARIAQIDSENAFSPALVDTFRRRHDYLRISLTEKCNLRCFYCMPADGVELSPKEHILTDDEVIRLATLFVRSGVTKIRLTGGEPTVRKSIVELVGRLNELRPLGLKSIGMTSNGIALPRKLPDLVQNGLTHLNLSLDTLDPFKFELVTRRRGHDAVLRTLDMAVNNPGLKAVKVNVVVMKGLNDGEVLDFVEMTRNSPISVRFIEFMPFSGNSWKKDKMVPSSELLDLISSRHSNVQKASDELNDTARSYKIPGHAGSFGFISSMSDHFCSSCNRLRITADGTIKVCLFDSTEVSLRDIMRSGASDQDLTAVIGAAVGNKKEKHAGMEDIDVVHNRPMILIGGVPTLLPARFTTPMFPSVPHVSITHAVRPNINHSMFSHRSTPVLFSSTGFSSRSYAGHIRQKHSKATLDEIPPPTLTHIDQNGHPSMVNVGEKQVTRRRATASGSIILTQAAFDLISQPIPDTKSNDALEQAKAKARSKGDVLTVAQLAGIMACKSTSSLIPLCHPIPLTLVQVRLVANAAKLSVKCTAVVECDGKTGVEMEALTAVSVSLLTVWDMVKAVAGKEMIIQDIMVVNKSGGKSGDWSRV